MIVGNGQLSQVFRGNALDDIVIFASGVANSNCVDEKEFNREKKLLIDTLNNSKNKKFVYFSSCALSAKEYPKNAYYNHKENTEQIIKKNSSNYYIFRIPQLFGELKSHNTLINFLYKSIVQSKRFTVYDKAYRYVIEINDVSLLVSEYLKFSKSAITVDLANPYRYNILDIVNTLEKLLDKKANYDLIDKSDGYILNLSDINNFIEEYNIDIKFSKNYLFDKLKEKLTLC